MTFGLTPQAGIVEEMLEDTLDVDEDEELEQEADAEVDRVLFEITDGKLGEASLVGADLPVSYVLVPHGYVLIVRSGVGQQFGRGDREEYGEVPRTVERPFELIISLTICDGPLEVKQL